MLGVAVLAVALTACSDGGGLDLPPVTRNLPVTLGDQSFTLVDGIAEKPAAAGSAATETVRAVGDPVIGGDVTGDGKPEAALLLTDDPGGSGTFYYAVLALSGTDSWRATNALPLGDRIEPQGIDFADGHFVYRFLERRPGEPMSEPPSVPRTVVIGFDRSTGRISA